jgi:hypothetical protein
MKKVFITLTLIFIVSSGFAQGFDATSINFELPAGGNITTTENNSYYDINDNFGAATDLNDSNLWYVMDMNGDAKSDLLIIQEKVAGNFAVPGTTGNRYWKVHLNTGSGFEATAINWALPAGGNISATANNSYYDISDNFGATTDLNGSNLWYVMDMNGDAKPDLLVIQEKVAGNFAVPGTTGNRNWKVYLNNGSGFETTAINWALPTGGNIVSAANNSYYDINDNFGATTDLNGSTLWYVMDMNGDRAPDLLVHQEKQAGAYKVLGTTGNRYWRVYLNNGAGFETTAINWALPEGGNIVTAANNSYYDINDNIGASTDLNGSTLWYVMDMNGDRAPDLLVHSEKQADTYKVLGTTGNRYWRVYLNSGSGFETTAINWTLPAGGNISATANNSYYDISDNFGATIDLNGSNLWYVMDMNGDRAPDLLVHREKQGGEYKVLGTTGNRYWKVYLNNSSSFETSPINWSLPEGGNISSTSNNSYYDIYDNLGGTTDLDGSNLWYVMDMNGDTKSDLLVFQEKSAGNFAVPGTTNNRYWKVYLNNSSPLSTDENPLTDNRIIIYPNPLKDFSTITFNEIQENTTLNIFDLTGKKVMTDTFSGSDYTLKKGNLQPGLYMLQLIDASKNITTKKLVIQ